MNAVPAVAAIDRCDACATELAAGLLVCPGCRKLIHAATLKALAADASAAAAAGDVRAELTAWRASLDLLPPATRQYEVVRERVTHLSRQTETPAERLEPTGRLKWLARFGPAGAVIFALATKGKLLLLGLTKASTFFSMLLAFGVYWTQWGAWFALGVILSIYVHEMGHVAALRQYGIAATAPMFIPGLGALVRLRQAPLTPREDARVGLAGPIWGCAAAIVAFLAGRATGSGMWLAIAHTGAWLNLFNLLPVWQLDGNRGFASLTSSHRWIAVAALATAWIVTHDGLLVLMTLVALVRARGADAPEESDGWTLASYVTLVAVLSGLSYIAQTPAV